jgi:TRAP-type C4-dicarboxylate transport system permease small subunit
LDKLIRRLEQLSMAIAVACIALIVPIISCDAIGRYVFRAPVPWAFEFVTYYMLVAGTYLALCATYQHGDHIRIDLFQSKFPKPVRAWLDIVCSILAVAAFTLIAYGAWMNMVEAYQRKEFVPGYILWPVWLSFLPIPIGSGLLVLRLAHHSVTMARHGEDLSVNTQTDEALA